MFIKNLQFKASCILAMTMAQGIPLRFESSLDDLRYLVAHRLLMLVYCWFVHLLIGAPATQLRTTPQLYDEERAVKMLMSDKIKRKCL